MEKNDHDLHENTLTSTEITGIFAVDDRRFAWIECHGLHHSGLDR
jgi:hypothetical protein